MSDRPSAPILSRSHIFTIAFFGIFLFLIYEMGRLITPFSADLLWAGIIALALHPLYRRMATLLRGRTALSAGIMTLVTLIIVIGPAIALLAVLVSQTVDLYQWAAEGIASGAAVEFWQKINALISQKILTLPFLGQIDLKEVMIKGLSQFSSTLASQVGAVLKDGLLLVVHLFIMLTVLFFFFKNGETYYRTAMDLLPFSADQKQAVARKLHDTFTAVINGVFLIALGQGMMTGIGFAVFSVPFPVFWGFLAAILALLPIGGAALVWIPGVLYLMLSHATIKGILLALWGIILVSLPDNFLKPLVIGKKANIPVLFLFLGILGGLRAYGFLGILFGPLIVTLLTAFIQIYREEFAEE